MRKAAVLIGVGFVVAACKAGVGTNGAYVKDAPPDANAKVDVKGSLEAKPASMSEGDAEAACAAIRGPECDRIERCSPKVMASDYGDKATCIKRQIAECKAVFVLPGTKVSMEQAKACGAKRGARACDATADVPECLLPGTIPDNGACLSTNECASGYCEGSNAGTCGKCKPRVAPKGAPDGAACKADGDCNTWARCEGGKCAPAGRQKGGKCSQSSSCANLLNLGCSFTTCIEATTLAEPGTPCKPDDKTKTMPFCKGGRCDAASGKCIAFKNEGESCDNDLACGTNLHCDRATKKCGVIKIEASCWK